MSGPRATRGKPTQEDHTTKKKDTDEPQMDPSNTAILLALEGQEDRLAKKVKIAVKEAVEEMLTGEIETLKTMIASSNTAIAKLSQDIATQDEASKALRGRVVAMDANVKQAKRDVTTLQEDTLTLRQKLTEMEDRSRRCNIRLVGLAEAAEGENAIQFLQQNLPVWIPSLAGEKIEIQRAHRIYTPQVKPSRPRTLIFQLLRYQDREKIFNGVRALASPPTHQTSKEGQTFTSRLLFFPDYSNETARRRKTFDTVRKQMVNRGLRPFLVYPAILKVRHNGTLHFFEEVNKAEKFMSTLDRSPHSSPDRPSAPSCPALTAPADAVISTETPVTP